MGRHLLQTIPVHPTGTLTGERSGPWGKSGYLTRSSVSDIPSEHSMLPIWMSNLFSLGLWGHGIPLQASFLLASVLPLFMVPVTDHFGISTFVRYCCLLPLVLSRRRKEKNKREKMGHGYLLFSARTCTYLNNHAHNSARISESGRLPFANVHREFIHHCTDE